MNDHQAVVGVAVEEGGAESGTGTAGTKVRRRGQRDEREFVALSEEVRTHVDTACASFHLGRKPQTMRVWASTEGGPIRPVRVNGRLAWAVRDIRKLLIL